MAAALFGAAAQEPETPPAASPPAAALATLHGEVRNGATGQPLPRALVKIEGDADTGALTDGEGRFEIPAVPLGPQAIRVVKPGFLDRPSLAGAAIEGVVGPAHNVLVAPEMPDLVFTLAPTSSIRGQIELSTGDPAQGIDLNLLRRSVEDGRAVWKPVGWTKTGAEGAYRFAGLADGVYAIYTAPALESEPAAMLVDAASTAKVARAGYASVFYPNARDLAGAAHIQISGGEQAQANLTLTLEPFHTVAAEVVFPGVSRVGGANAASPGANLTALVMDAQGRILPYNAEYDQTTKTLQATLPDGVYSLLVTMILQRPAAASAGNPATIEAEPFTGSVEFSLAGHDPAHLRIPISSARANPIQATVDRSGPLPASDPRGMVMVMLSQAGGQSGEWIDDGMVSAYASGAAPGPLETAYTLPGQYWVHTHVAQKGLCEASFTAGGTSLAREPLAVGVSGATAPLALALRDGCSRLTLGLPQSLATASGGEEPFYTVYVVPDFDSTVDVEPVTLRPSTGGSFTLQDLTPGRYHVYAFDAPVRLEYRNPAVLAALPNPSQAVTLSPGASANLVVEVPGR